jgi:putative transcriptional regulator
MTDAIYNRIAMFRAERAISRRQLAEALGVHYQTIGYLERGEYSPSLHLALRIAEYFEVPVEVIFSTCPFPRLGSPEEPARKATTPNKQHGGPIEGLVPDQR